MVSENQSSRSEQLICFLKTLEVVSDYDEVLRLSNDFAKTLFDCEDLSILMINPRTSVTVKTIYSNKEDNPNKILHNYVSGWILKNNKSFFSIENKLPSFISNRTEFKNRKVSIISSPLINGGKVIGVIFLLKEGRDNYYNNEDLILLNNYATVISPFLGNTQNIYKYFTPTLSKKILLEKFRMLGMIGSSESYIVLLKSIETASRSSVRVVIQGESGTGKELVARAVHKLSDRRENNFVAIDCGAMPKHLIESELFGHVKGAFTGAESNRIGLFEEADGGTLFMDEISNLPFETQSKLLRVLQENEIRPLGSNKTKKIDVRIITASSSSLYKIIDQGKFREDLFYRLFVYPINVPSLVDRKEDIPMLINYFLNKYSANQKKEIACFDDQAMTALLNNQWRGNIRELENNIERIVSETDFGTNEILFEGLPEELRSNVATEMNEKSLPKLVEHYESELIRKALKSSDWNQTAAARKLEIPEQTLRYKMKKFNITKSLLDYS